MNENEKNKKILIVDDDEFLLEMYSIKFKEAGFTVDVAREGHEALQKTKEFAPAVILLDVVLPELDGFEVLREIRKENYAPEALVIMLTNLGQKDDAERGINMGADDYIVKAHFTPSEVVEKVRKALSGKK